MSEQQDRTPLTQEEYYSLRLVFGFVTAIENALPVIEKRARRVPGAWRDLKMLSTKGQGLITKLLTTVPSEKIRIIYKELRNMRTRVDIIQPGLPEPEHDGFTYVPTDALDALIRGVVTWECAFCEKDKKAARRCEWRKVIEATYPYDLPEKGNEGCRFSGWTIEHNGGEYEQI